MIRDGARDLQESWDAPHVVVSDKWWEPIDAEEARAFLKMSKDEFKKRAPEMPRYPVSARAFLYLRPELLDWLKSYGLGGSTAVATEAHSPALQGTKRKDVPRERGVERLI